MSNTFEIITSAPKAGDPYLYLYNNSANGGKSYCINGKPTNPTCNVLSNCVGWACGRFNHIYNLLTGYDGIKYPLFCCNAENFIEVATDKYGLKVGTTPMPGAIICWRKGTLSGNDGVGHVGVVEKVIDENTIITSESSWGGVVFNNMTRNNSAGNWGGGRSHVFRGFIYNPAVDGYTTVEGNLPIVPSTNPKIPTPVARNTKRNQIYVKIDCLRVRTRPSIQGQIVGMARPGYYNYEATMDKDGYTWYKIGNESWIAYNKKWATVYKAYDMITVGAKIKLDKNAVSFDTGKRFSDWTYGEAAEFYIRRINGDRVVFSVYKNTGPVSGSVDKKFIKVID